MWKINHHCDHAKDSVFHILEDEIAKLPTNSNVLIVGDFNAHIGNASGVNMQIFGNEGEFSEIMPEEIPDGKFLMQEIDKYGSIERSSMDRRDIDTYGHDLLEMCKTTELVILNGRVGSDEGIGQYTCTRPNGRTVVDYMMCSPELLKYVTDFRVLSKVPESDHHMLRAAIQCQRKINVGACGDDNKWTQSRCLIQYHKRIETRS